jgi:hypothetical protein
MQTSNFLVYQVEAPAARVRAHLLERRMRDGGADRAEFEREIALGRQLVHRIIDNGGYLEHTAATMANYIRMDFPEHSPSIANGKPGTEAQP